MSEVVHWSSTQIAHYLMPADAAFYDISRCEHIVESNNITGRTLLNMTKPEATELFASLSVGHKAHIWTCIMGA